MTFRIQGIAGLSAATALAALLIAGPALADGVAKKGSMKDPPKPAERCKHSANVALATEYVFRGTGCLTHALSAMKSIR